MVKAARRKSRTRRIVGRVLRKHTVSLSAKRVRRERARHRRSLHPATTQSASPKMRKVDFMANAPGLAALTGSNSRLAAGLKRTICSATNSELHSLCFFRTHRYYTVDVITLLFMIFRFSYIHHHASSLDYLQTSFELRTGSGTNVSPCELANKKYQHLISMGMRVSTLPCDSLSSPSWAFGPYCGFALPSS